MTNRSPNPSAVARVRGEPKDRKGEVSEAASCCARDIPSLPARAGKPADYGAQACLHGPASTPVITVTTLNAANTTATLRQIADTIKFS